MEGIGNLWKRMPRRFSLRVLLLTILGLCTLLGWVSWKLDRHQQQRSIVSSINGAHASYSFGDVWELQLLGRTSDDERESAYQSFRA
jgi:hypothetical protein